MKYYNEIEIEDGLLLARTGDGFYDSVLVYEGKILPLDNNALCYLFARYYDQYNYYYNEEFDVFDHNTNGFISNDFWGKTEILSPKDIFENIKKYREYIINNQSELLESYDPSNNDSINQDYYHIDLAKEYFCVMSVLKHCGMQIDEKAVSFYKLYESEHLNAFDRISHAIEEPNKMHMFHLGKTTEFYYDCERYNVNCMNIGHIDEKIDTVIFDFTKYGAPVDVGTGKNKAFEFPPNIKNVEINLPSREWMYCNWGKVYGEQYIDNLIKSIKDCNIENVYINTNGLKIDEKIFEELKDVASSYIVEAKHNIESIIDKDIREISVSEYTEDRKIEYIKTDEKIQVNYNGKHIGDYDIEECDDEIFLGDLKLNEYAKDNLTTRDVISINSHNEKFEKIIINKSDVENEENNTIYVKRDKESMFFDLYDFRNKEMANICFIDGREELDIVLLDQISEISSVKILDENLNVLKTYNKENLSIMSDIVYSSSKNIDKSFDFKDIPFSEKSILYLNGVEIGVVRMCEETIIGIDLNDNVMDELVVKDTIEVDGEEYNIIGFKNKTNDNDSKNVGIEI